MHDYINGAGYRIWLFTLCSLMVLHLSKGNRTQICPLSHHIVCNSAETIAIAATLTSAFTLNSKDIVNKIDDNLESDKVKSNIRRTNVDLACTCAMAQDEAAPNHPSCTRLLNVPTGFEAVSIKLIVDEDIAKTNEFVSTPLKHLSIHNAIESRLRRDLAVILNINEENVIILRIGCFNEKSKVSTKNIKPIKSSKTYFVVQLVVTKQKNNQKFGQKLPINVATSLMDSDVVTHRISAYSNKKPLAGFQFVNADTVEELFEVESYTVNTTLIIQVTLAALFLAATSLCGCWVAFGRKKQPNVRECKK